jgi:hypothetical protein
VEGDDGDVVRGKKLLYALLGYDVVDLHGGEAEARGGFRELVHGVAVAEGEAALRPHSGEGMDGRLRVGVRRLDGGHGFSLSDGWDQG